MMITMIMMMTGGGRRTEVRDRYRDRKEAIRKRRRHEGQEKREFQTSARQRGERESQRNERSRQNEDVCGTLLVRAVLGPWYDPAVPRGSRPASSEGNNIIRERESSPPSQSLVMQERKRKPVKARTGRSEWVRGRSEQAHSNEGWHCRHVQVERKIRAEKAKKKRKKERKEWEKEGKRQDAHTRIFVEERAIRVDKSKGRSEQRKQKEKEKAKGKGKGGEGGREYIHESL